MLIHRKKNHCYSLCSLSHDHKRIIGQWLRLVNTSNFVCRANMQMLHASDLRHVFKSYIFEDRVFWEWVVAFFYSRCKFTPKHGIYPRCFRRHQKKWDMRPITLNKAPAQQRRMHMVTSHAMPSVYWLSNNPYLASTSFSLYALFLVSVVVVFNKI